MKPWAIIVDMDGTLALHNGRSPFDYGRCNEDLVNEPIKHLVNKYASDHIIIVVSGREEWCRHLTEAWLKLNFIRYDEILMRTTGDHRKDTIIKPELYTAHIKDKYKIRFVVDDRKTVVATWRSLGLTVLQVADGDF